MTVTKCTNDELIILIRIKIISIISNIKIRIVSLCCDLLHVVEIKIKFKAWIQDYTKGGSSSVK